MRTHLIQHVPFEGLGFIEDWLQLENHTVSVTQCFAADRFPHPDTIDFLVIMGGPMSVHYTTAYPWLLPEQALIRQVIEAGKPVLGICLGAQLIAQAMGGEVHPSQQKEIGWMPIHATGTEPDHAFHFHASEEVFHWHGETFDLPPGAMHLATSEACEHQAFQLGRSVIGLQFHLETTPESVRQIVTHCSADLTPSPYVQTAEEILTPRRSSYQAIHTRMSDLLHYLLADSPTP